MPSATVSFADAFQRDPDFFSFYRSMQAYTKSLAGTDTTLVLTPDSEFFRHFGMGGRGSPRVQQAAPEQEMPAPQASQELLQGVPQAAQVEPQQVPSLQQQ
jgi:modulator of FtsH protease HflC